VTEESKLGYFLLHCGRLGVFRGGWPARVRVWGFHLVVINIFNGHDGLLPRPRPGSLRWLRFHWKVISSRGRGRRGNWRLLPAAECGTHKFSSEDVKASQHRAGAAESQAIDSQENPDQHNR